jgi:MoxR-like ATPase
MFGMSHVTKLIIIAIICNDHILLEDVPGTGKTKLTKTIARILDLNFKRIQGTPDLLPGDLTGINIYDQTKNEFRFIPGPIFTNILLFDEINRASPKTQSALLQAMEECQVSADNLTYKIEKPFFVIATQNPVEYLGTYPLPQAQLDRFLIKTKIGYPNEENERKIMLEDAADLEDLKLPKLHKDTIEIWQKEYRNVYIKDDLVDKIISLVKKTRESDLIDLGVSPRATKKLTKALKASAYIHDRDFVTKDDVYDLFLPVMAHRIFTSEDADKPVILERMLQEANI